MKLKCTKHDRRVHKIGETFVHQNGEKCDSEVAYIGDKVINAKAAQFLLKHRF